MLKNSAVNAKIARPVGPKRIEKPKNVEKSSTKHDENKDKANVSAVATSSRKTVAATKNISSNPGTNPIAKSQTNSKTVLGKSKQISPSPSIVKPKVSNVATNKVIRQQPIRAIHQVQPKKPVAEKNVMNTIHNVTVASPPSIRKEQTIPQLSMESLPTDRGQTNHKPSIDTLPRERTKTRTLEPEEVVILNQSMDDRKTTKTSVINSDISIKVEQKPLVIQEPVAFEISFEKPATIPTSDSSSKDMVDTSDGDYEDDFDSYESDFETESSTSSRTTSSKSDDDSKSASTQTESQAVVSIAKKLDEDRDFDSGTYELKGGAEKLQLDSIDDRELHSEGQSDSGFGYNVASSPIEQSSSTFSSIHSKPSIKPTYNKRGMELMKKINLDTMAFTLFELKPLSYDLYMKIYGHKNTNQSSSQTTGNLIDQDSQTESKSKQTIWTQYPPNFIANNISTENYHQDRIGCGEGIEHTTAQNADECLLENSLRRINRTNVLKEVRSTKLIDYERLNFFLQKSAITVSAICDTSVVNSELSQSNSTFSDGFFQISINESNILNDTTVYYMYSNPKIENIIYLAHRQKSTSRSHDNSYVSVWSISDTKKPIHILSCWSLIICLEVHHHLQDVVIAGLTDGCVAVWNLNEFTLGHQNTDCEALPPTQIVSPSIDTTSISFDFGCIISLKSVHQPKQIQDDDFKLTQICSLHEFGILTIWTILKTNSYSTNPELSNERKIDHRSPWSKIQLIQSNIIDIASINLNKKLRPKSGFEKKKMYFESNLFNDAALRELHDFDARKDLLDQSESVRYVDMEFHEDEVAIATNKSFLIFVSTSLNRDSFRKILIDDSNFLHATKLKSLDEVLLVGLTDGSIKVIKVKSDMCRKSKEKYSETAPDVTTLEQNNFSAKSCAIQNIVKEGRKNFNDGMEDRFRHIAKVTDDTTTVQGSRFINNQVLLPAMSSSRDYVRWMDVSINLNCMLSLCGRRLRMVNFQNFVEARGGDVDERHNEIGFATIVLGYNHSEYMVNLEENSVRVHLLRKKTLQIYR